MGIEEKTRSLLQGETGDYILPFFWQHGEDEETLRKYMNVIHGANIHSVCVESRPHREFGKAKWWQDMDAILDEAQKLDMRVWILDDQHFPTGYAAGAMENAPDDLCHLYMDYNTASVCGPVPCVELNVEKMAHPRPTPPWIPKPANPGRTFGDDRLFRVTACPIEEGSTIGTPVDLTAQVKDGILHWDVPAGYWTIYVVYLTRNAHGRNNYINFLDSASCRILVDAVYEPHYQHYKHLFGNTIAGFFSDEPPVGNTPGYTHGDIIGKPDMSLSWSDAMDARMTDEYGEGWQDMMPYLWQKGTDEQATAGIRTAYMNAVSKLVQECFSEQLGVWCSEHGVEYIGHMLEDCDASAGLGPSMGHFFRGLAGQHMAGIDNIGGQVMIGGQDVARFPGGACQDDAGFYHYLIGRMGASMAAIDPKKKGRCLCENFGAYGWQTGVYTEKYLMDHFLARGVNRYVPHAFTPKAFPDPDCPPHFWAHGENPEYRAFGALMQYSQRICHLIDGGQCVAPVALLYHGESQWGGAYESNILACRALSRAQIAFVMVPDDVFADEELTSFNPDTKVLTVNGIPMRALVISGCDFLPGNTARFAACALKADFPVVCTTRRPHGVCDAASREESDALTAALSGMTVVPVSGLAAEIDARVARDITLQPPFADLTAYHYENDGDVWLILNESPSACFDQAITLNASAPLCRYDAWDNRITAVDSTLTDGKATLHLHLQPLEMAVLVASDDLAAKAEMPLKETLSIPVEGFTVTQATTKEYPVFHTPMAPDFVRGMGAQLPGFSGFLRYETRVTVPAVKKAAVEIAQAYDSAEVFVNGKSAGIRASRPCRFDIGALLREGENEIAIETATTLERKMAASGVDTACMSPLNPMMPIGLVGSVTVLAEK